MKIEHEGYVLEIEEVTDYDTGKNILYKTKCNELPYLPQGIYKTDLNSIISGFKKEVKNQMNKTKEVENVKVTITKDQDVTLVYQFIGALNKVANEMELLEEDEYSGNVLTVKLKKVYDEYKDRVMPSSTFESFIDYYSYLQTKKEEEKREIANKEYHNKLSIIKRDNETKLNDLHEEYKEILGLILEDVKTHYLNTKAK